jgi:Putative Ig domain
MKKLFSLLILSCLFVSCTSGKPAANSDEKPSAAQQGDSSGAAALEITPGEAVRNSVLNLSAKGFNLSEATVVWLVNNAIADGPASCQFHATNVVRGDTIQARAVLREQTILSNIVKIGNTLPEITSLKLLPEVFKPGDTLSLAAAGTDADGDAVSFTYEWKKNGVLASNTNTLGCPVQRGDKISVTITPYDGREYGRPAVIEREIRNMPPVIVEHKECGFDGSVYTYQVRASDPDGDTLTYSLESPPDGMTIDRSTGLLKWVVPQEFKGKKSVTVSVNDGNGGTASYSFEIAIQ